MVNGHIVVDCHAHIGYFDRAHVVLSEYTDLLEEMDRAGVEQSCISSFLSIGPDEMAGNDMVGQAIEHYPDRFVGYAVVNPNRPDKAESELNRCFDSLGCKAIKLHPAFHHYPIEGLGYKKTLEFAAQRRSVILSHDWGSPEILERLSSSYPAVRFIIAHTGFWDARREFAYAGVIRQHSNVFVELAYSNIYYGALDRLVVELGASKVLFGSDCVLHDQAYQLGRVVYSRLSNDDQRLILGENMRRLLASGGSN